MRGAVLLAYAILDRPWCPRDLPTDRDELIALGLKLWGEIHVRYKGVV